jgi:hypothetical protein
MVPIATPSRRVGIALLIIAVVVVGASDVSVNTLPGFSDHTGPSEMEITEFERVDSGCADDLSSFRGTRSGPGGTYTKHTFIRTEDADADLSAWVERTSPPGADLSTFRVHVDSHHEGPANETCDTGVLYRITINGSGGSPEGFLPDAHGTRILWLENGRFAGCSGSVTSPLESGCQRFVDQPERTWANATDGA